MSIKINAYHVIVLTSGMLQSGNAQLALGLTNIVLKRKSAFVRRDYLIILEHFVYLAINLNTGTPKGKSVKNVLKIHIIQSLSKDVLYVLLWLLFGMEHNAWGVRQELF